MAQMAQMEAAYAQMHAQAAMGIPASGPYGVPSAAATTKAAKNAAQYSDTDWGIPGFGEALTEAVMPILNDPSQIDAVEDIKYKVGTKIMKSTKKFANDERKSTTGTALYARIIVEEFVHWTAGAVSQAFYDKPWLEKVNLAAPLLAAALHTFNGSKIFTRTLAPMLPKYVEEALFGYAEEERVTKAMFDAVIASGVKDNMHKKCSNLLAKSYDSAHVKAPYGSTAADSADMGMLQDFVKGWMFEFCMIAREILMYGVGSIEDKPSRGDQILFVTVLFQNLTDARNAALPHELTSLIETPPPSPWAFIAESAEAVFDDVDSAQKLMKGKGMGMDGGKGGCGGKGGGKGGWGGGMEGMMQMMEMMMGGFGGKGGW